MKKSLKIGRVTVNIEVSKGMGKEKFLEFNAHLENAERIWDAIVKAENGNVEASVKSEKKIKGKDKEVVPADPE